MMNTAARRITYAARRLALSSSATTCARSSPVVASKLESLRWLSSTDSNITYSGGQAMEGQGGFYGSGGARASAGDTEEGTEGRALLLAVASDVQTISKTMDEVERLNSLLRSEEAEKVTSKSIEIKSSIKKLMTGPEFVEALNRLEVEGAPVWGLSTDEREMIVMARELMTTA